MPTLFWSAPEGEENQQIQASVHGQGGMRMVAAPVAQSDVLPEGTLAGQLLFYDLVAEQWVATPTAPADGQFAQWDEAGNQWVFVSVPSAPLTATMWVDADTAVALADQTGSIAAPFATAQQAHDALPADGGSIVVCFSALGTSAGDIAVTKTLGLQGIGRPGLIGNVGSFTEHAVTLANITAGDVEVEDEALELREGATVTNISASLVRLFDSTVTNTVEAQALVSRDSAVGGALTIASSVASHNSTFGALTMTAPGFLTSEDDTWAAVSAAQANITAQGSAFVGALACSVLEATQCTLGGELGVDEIDIGDRAELRECNVGLDTTVVGGLDLFNCTTGTDTDNVVLDSGSGHAINCELGGDWDSGAELSIDLSTYERAIASGFAVTATARTFNDQTPAAVSRAYAAAAPLTLEARPAGHAAGLYAVDLSIFVRTFGVGNLNVTITWDQPLFGATSLNIGTAALATTRIFNTSVRPIESSGVSPINVVLTPSIVTVAPVIDSMVGAQLVSGAPP